MFDGSQPLELRQSWELPAYLYPGERVPVGRARLRALHRGQDGLDSAKRAELPGPRPKLAVTVENTEAAVGTGTLNFSYRFRYKYVVVHGRVRNDDQAAVKKVKVWISLYDAQDQLTGARSEELRLPRLAPGDSAPFQLDVKQYGANFKRVASTPCPSKGRRLNQPGPDRRRPCRRLPATVAPAQVLYKI